MSQEGSETPSASASPSAAPGASTSASPAVAPALEEGAAEDPGAHPKPPSKSDVERHRSWPPLTPGVSKPPPPQLLPEDLELISRLRDAGMMNDAGLEELNAIAEKLGQRDGVARMLDLIQQYFSAPGQPEKAAERARAFRFFAHHSGDPANVSMLVHRLGKLFPEVGDMAVERIGDNSGPLVLRAQGHFGAIFDDEDDEEDDDDAEGETVTVRGVIRALNVLLGRLEIRERLIGVRSDGERELYIALSAGDASTLCKSLLLEIDDIEDLLEFAGW